jgi:hypothetical protein
MFGRKSNDDTQLDEAIERLLSEMIMYGPDSEDYLRHLEYLERLNRLKDPDRGRRKLSADTVAQVAGSLLGIMIIVIYEQKHILNSRGLSFVPKTK